MTLQEICWELNLSEKTLSQKFWRTKENFLKRGIVIEKHGKGKKADYTITRIDKNKE
jgi:hypothetical protein